MTISKLISYTLIPAYKTSSNIKQLLADASKISYSLFAFIVLGVLYTITVFIGYKNGFGATAQPFLIIPAENYYLWETFFAIPVFFVIAITFSGTNRLTSIFFKGTGSFENTFSIYCIALFLPTILTMWLPESIIMAFFHSQKLTTLGGFKLFPEWFDILRQIAGILWPFIIMIIGVKYSENLTWLTSIIITAISYIPAIGLMIIFIR